MTIEVWQNAFNNEWNCDITTCDGEQNATQYWAVENFCDLLNLIAEKIPNAKIQTVIES